MDDFLSNILKQAYKDIKPFDIEKGDIYAYKKEGKIRFCDSLLNPITKKRT